MSKHQIMRRENCKATELEGRFREKRCHHYPSMVKPIPKDILKVILTLFPF